MIGAQGLVGSYRGEDECGEGPGSEPLMIALHG